MLARPTRILERLQVREDVAFLLFREEVAVGRHPIAALIDLLANVLLIHRFSVSKFLVLEQTLQRWPDLPVVVVGIVANAALLKNLFTLGRIARLLRKSGGRSEKKHAHQA